MRRFGLIVGAALAALVGASPSAAIPQETTVAPVPRQRRRSEHLRMGTRWYTSETSPNGGGQSGVAAAKRAARKRRNISARAPK